MAESNLVKVRVKEGAGSLTCGTTEGFRRLLPGDEATVTRGTFERRRHKLEFVADVEDEPERPAWLAGFPDEVDIGAADLVPIADVVARAVDDGDFTEVEWKNDLTDEVRIKLVEQAIENMRAEIAAANSAPPPSTDTEVRTTSVDRARPQQNNRNNRNNRSRR